MKFKIIVLLSFCLISSLNYAQTGTCNCEKDFDFLVTSYINDYSGIQDFAKLHPDYLQTIDKLSKQAKTTTTLRKCDKIIGNLIKYLFLFG